MIDANSSKGNERPIVARRVPAPHSGGLPRGVSVLERNPADPALDHFLRGEVFLVPGVVLGDRSNGIGDRDVFQQFINR
jgi:hypothetical protein